MLYPGGDKSRRTTAGSVKTFVAVGLNLLKESEISAPQPEEISVSSFYFNCFLYFLLSCKFFTNRLSLKSKSNSEGRENIQDGIVPFKWFDDKLSDCRFCSPLTPNGIGPVSTGSLRLHKEDAFFFEADATVLGACRLGGAIELGNEVATESFWALCATHKHLCWHREVGKTNVRS
ncbi:hypothetical protein MTR67_000495 [Solanum verrucosum]|uniref:Uncharacterized protein n=1 Tax=Solanum verrucosum TaxID=315347 RepID=A0AAF0PQ50_SOLVR|nr:hypothetical protein MTR67_000495 [Solanum verrucosum]